MRIYPIECGYFKLDGGAMFGVVPKSIWQKTNPADSNNKIELATRAMLVEKDKRLILIDTGIGDKQSERFFSYYDLWGEYSLDHSLAKYGFHRDDITDVFMTHLHFDHCGGSVRWNKNRSGYEPAFKNAYFWTNKSHWDWALNPNAREKASFLKENLLPMEASGQLKFIENQSADYIAQSEMGFGIFFVDGHTERQMLPVIQYNEKKIVFMADLLPSVGHIPIPYVMSYDTRPLLTLDEKTKFLSKAADQNYYLFLEHDVYHEIITVKHTEKGIRMEESFSCKSIFGS